ncbi:AAA family ATPase [Ceratobasidium sp. AG-Ba]|nr:AAA family ATPase [Ceratobasidium sp. AG-Ba]
MDGQPSYVPTLGLSGIAAGDAIQLPACALDAMWKSQAMNTVDPRALPPSCYLGDALSQLRTTLLPKVQHNATHVGLGSQIVEPTLALFCPIEGGEYVIDATVKELAEKTNSEVQVIDMAQVAADRWGVFGESALGLKMTDHLLNEVTIPDSPYPRYYEPYGANTTNASSFEVFWNKVIKCDPPAERANLAAPLPTTPSDATSNGPTPRPRIVYIRDFGLLSSQTQKWFPALYSAIRARRTGGLGPESPISHPTTIVFGFCPRPAVAPSPSSGYVGCTCSLCVPGAKGSRNLSDTESAREKRLKERFEKWDKGTLLKDLPLFTPQVKIVKDGAGPGVKFYSGAGLVEQTGVTREEKPPTHDLVANQAGLGQAKDSYPEAKNTEEWVDVKIEPEDAKQEEKAVKPTDDTTPKSPILTATNPYSSPISYAPPYTPLSLGYPFPPQPAYEQKLDGYFRSCIIAPAKRNLDLERTARESRLQELNELRLRVVVGSMGGVIEDGAGLSSLEGKREIDGVELDDHTMRIGWEKRLLDVTELNAIVDRALEASRSSDQDGKNEGAIRLTWTGLREAWRAHQTAEETRSAWKASNGFSKEQSDNKELSTDDVIAKVKSEGLDEFERQWIEYVVGPAKITTTFEDVHLPSEIIDTIRSTVSIPLLYPEAFQSGILKDQTNTGVLLFGPPGTGKSSVVEALAKESGSRMLTVNPSIISSQYYMNSGQILYSVFKLAQRLKPCLVFIEGIETLASSETSNSTLLNHLVQAFNRLSDPGVIVIGATSRPFDINHAILRHLTCRLLIDLPELDAREKILKNMLREEKLAADVSTSELAQKTDGFSGSDLKNLCVTAAREALKDILNLPRPSREDGITQASKPNNEETQTGHADNTENGSKLQARILAATHFTRALTKAKPLRSHSQDTLIEIRKWNSKFGTSSGDTPNNGLLS